MTDFLRLHERIDESTVDVADLVARVEAHTVVLDWVDVTSIDHDTLRAILSPFLDRIEQLVHMLQDEITRLRKHLE